MLGLLIPLFLMGAGCHRDNVKVYRIAKDQDQTSSQPAAPARSTDSPNPGLPAGHPDISTMPGGPADSAAPQLTWKTPAGWTEETPSQMRVASFKVTGADGKQVDISVIPLPGMAGSDEANVNRWRGQVGLPAVSDDEVKKSAESVTAGGQPAQLYDIAGTNPDGGAPERIIGVIQHRSGMEWFYKMTGDSNLVEQQKPAFVEFLKSLNFGAAAPAELPAGHPAVGGDMGALLSAPASSSAGNKPNWQVPAGWQEVPPGQFLLAEYSITGANGAKAEVNVAQMNGANGEGSGLLANVNRWRRQIGLDAVDESGLGKLTTSLDVTGGKATLVDMTGTDLQTSQPTRLVGVIVPMNGQAWFYKLMGDANVVESQKAAFIQFVQGVKY
ncbi:MAG TPA: hypothetical protein VFY06_00880 [Verrucomicrobiae bacterium]|nr:hypothetical protein [Verrucomicrobiae bacterium]